MSCRQFLPEKVGKVSSSVASTVQVLSNAGVELQPACSPPSAFVMSGSLIAFLCMLLSLQEEALQHLQMLLMTCMLRLQIIELISLPVLVVTFSRFEFPKSSSHPLGDSDSAHEAVFLLETHIYKYKCLHIYKYKCLPQI